MTGLSQLDLETTEKGVGAPKRSPELPGVDINAGKGKGVRAVVVKERITKIVPVLG